jgi:ferredoxin
MAHLTTRSGYAALVDRLNRFPQGAPPADSLYSILKLLFSEREASLVAQLPVLPSTAAKAARIWHMEEDEARRVLDELASRAILLDAQPRQGPVTYVLPPPMAGFFEFSLMRVRTDLDQKMLGELFYQYMNVEEEFIRALFAPTGTPLGRVFVQEPALPPELSLEVLDYERASEAVLSASQRAVGVCYCRHKMQHAGQACSAPMEICLTLNGVADALVRHEFARAVDVSEGLDLLQQAYENNLVQCGENVRQRVSFICNCCGCCCEALVAARRFAFLTPVSTTNYLPVVDVEKCSGCGKCMDACPVEAMSLVTARDPNHPRRRKAHVLEETCLGCGVCVRTCSKEAITLTPRARRVITPVNSAHRVVSMAIERGDLQDLVFGDQHFASHRAMAAVLGVILRLPPAKQILANQQLKSRYLEQLIMWGERKLSS